MSTITDAIEKTQKEREYMDYIKEHITNVQKAYELLKSMNIIEWSIELENEMNKRVKLHDASKYDKEELDAYRKKFHPTSFENKKDAEKEFDEAWKHHYENNDHHWQHRQNTETLNEGACIEMILDWMAMSMKFDNKVYDWYKSQKDIVLNSEEKEYVENILDKIKKWDKEE